MSNFKTHIIFVSGQPTPNVLPVMDRSMRPEQVVLCVTDEPGIQTNADFLVRYFQRHQIATRVYDIGNAYDYTNLCERFLNLAAEYDKNEDSVCVNLTGGTKLITIAAMECFASDFHCIYVNPEKNYVQAIGKNSHTPPEDLECNLKIEDFFAIHGFTCQSICRPKDIPDKKKIVCDALVQNYNKYEKQLGTLNFLAANAKKDLIAQRNLTPNEQVDDLLALFYENGFVGDYDDRKVPFPNEDARKFCNGFWLEDYVWLQLIELNRRLRLQDKAASINVISNMQTPNEFDAAFVYQNKLYLIECKTSNVSGSDQAAPIFYKQDSLQKLIGLFTKKILISYHHLEIYEQDRAKKLSIKIFQGDDLRGLATRLETYITGKKS